MYHTATVHSQYHYPLGNSTVIININLDDGRTQNKSGKKIFFPNLGLSYYPQHYNYVQAILTSIGIEREGKPLK